MYCYANYVSLYRSVYIYTQILLKYVKVKFVYTYTCIYVHIFSLSYYCKILTELPSSQQRLMFYLMNLFDL